MRHSLVFCLGLVMVSSAVVVRSQQQQAAPAAPAAAPAAPAQLIPVTAASLAAGPARFLGQTVSVHATVEASISSTLFTLDQDPKKPGAGEVLVIAPTLQSLSAPGGYVTVVGEVVPLDPAVIATKGRGYRLDPTMATRFAGKAVVLANSVVDASMKDLALVPPRPMTPEETAFDAVMKQVNPAFTELRRLVEAKDGAATQKQADTLADLFTKTEGFFAGRKTADAQGWAKEGVTLVRGVSTAAAAGNWDAVTEAVGKVQPLCTQCHTAHRERGEDGSYRVKR